MAPSRSVESTDDHAPLRRDPGSVTPGTPLAPRPDGELVWIHLGDGKDLPALIDLSERLQTLRPGLRVLFTMADAASAEACDRAQEAAQARPESAATGVEPGIDLLCSPAPEDTPDAVATFLDHWRPDVALWVWGGLRPNLISGAAERGIPLHLVSADFEGLDKRPDRWRADITRRVSRCFASASARSASAARRLARLGIPPEVITVLPPLQPSGQVLTCADSDLEELAQQLQGRPVWYAAALAPDEWREVLDAHLIALRSAHRLLLVLHVTRSEELADISAFLDRYGLSYATWSDGETARESTQVLLTDIGDEAGLWFRIAMVSFLGQSLAPDGEGQDPIAAAQLGTAILHGPYVARHAESYLRLDRARAAQVVRSAETMGLEVARLILPTASAAMAHAGWDVVTEGAEAVDSVIDLVQDSIDTR